MTTLVLVLRQSIENPVLHELNYRLSVVFASEIRKSLCEPVHVILLLLPKVAFDALAFETLKACKFIKTMNFKYKFSACL